MDYTGVIIEESLADQSILKDVKIVSTKTEAVTAEHKTPWLEQWTLHTVEVPEDRAESTAREISASLDHAHSWYADFKNDSTHFIIFRDKIFKVDRSKPEQYAEAVKHGLALGIPEYQLDFSPEVKEWGR